MQQFATLLQRCSHSSRLTTFMLLGLLVVSCVSDSVQLNSERIARKFGSYSVEVIENNDNTRVSNLYSEEPVGRVCRTFAVVGMPDAVDSSFAAEHARIVAGGSIGTVFRGNGWAIEKRHLYIGEMPVGKQALRLARLMHIEPPTTLAVHVYVFAVSKNGRTFDYAMIAEVHHPDYLTAARLRSVYGREYSGEEKRNDVRQILSLVRRKFRDAS